MDLRLVIVCLVAFMCSNLINADRFVCPSGVEYVAHSMPSYQTKDFLFYGLQQDIDSASQCAKFCYETEFCRSAAYHPKDRTCELAYANVMRCQDSGAATRVRQSQFADETVAIYCIQCPEGKISAKIDSPEPTTASYNSLNALDGNATTRISSVTDQPHPQFNGACFVEYEQKILANASFQTEKDIKLDECKCKCAATWHSLATASSSSSNRCRSFQYNYDRSECTLNSDARPATSASRYENTSSNFIDVNEGRTSYYDFTCQDSPTVTELINGYCKKFVPFKGLGIIAPSISAPSLSAPSSIDSKSPITSATNDSSCFDQVEGYVMTGVAGGLEHNVTLDQCKCLCANSASTGKYDFTCKSIMYYRSERDCVLNVDDRQGKPELFRKAGENGVTGGDGYRITYVGVTCKGDALKKLAESECKPPSIQASTAISILEATIKVAGEEKGPLGVTLGPLPVPGDKTDDCFVEINEYVLSGMASAIEANVTIDECKCLCADSVTRYGVVCLSIQYYADVKTCLMNRKNRIQEPNNFKRVVSSVPHTYLDYLCSDVGSKKDAYWEKKCANLKLPQTTNVKYASSTPGLVLGNGTTPASTTSTPLPTPALFFPTASTPTIIGFNIGTVRPLRLDSSTPGLVIGRRTPFPNPFPIPELSPSPTTTGTTTQLPLITAALFPRSSSTTGAPSPRVSPPVATGFGPCHYSAFYDTEFNGRRMIERIVVGDPLICFQNCSLKRCKSANILNFLGKYKYCELFLDSSIDYPQTNLVSYNAASVYFDSIQCERRS